MTTVISLIGEQNLPNLLPILHLKPAQVILVYTSFTEETAVRLTKLIKDQTDVTLLAVDAYDIDGTKNKLVKAVVALPDSDVLVNFTGGTKMMSLAAYQTAVELDAPIFYLQSQGKKSLLYWYKPENGRYYHHKPEEIPPLIEIDTYLRAYVDDYQVIGIRGNPNDKGHIFEQAVRQALEPIVDEIVTGVRLMGALEVDFIVRCGNQVGIVEAKSGSALKKAIDQLNTAGGKDYLGTYTHKFLVSSQKWDRISDLKQLAEARRIQIIELHSFGQSDMISPRDVCKLQAAICQTLGCIE